jgi:drug/metabolite transporter (DMT)-like permease
MQISDTRVAKRFFALSPNVQGALWILVSGLLFSIMSAVVKTLGVRLDSFQIAFFRCAFGLLTILPFMLRAGPSAFRTTRPMMHLTRALMGVTAMFCGFYAVTHLPLAEATAISFAKPLFMIVLAVLFLGEVVRWRRWTATAVGFAGVLIMVRPGVVPIELATGVALFGTVCVAIVVVLIKKMTRTESPLTILFSFGIVSTVVSAGPAIWVWRQPTLVEFLMLVSVGVLGAAGQACSIRGFKAGETTAVMPFDYARLLFAGAIGFWVFGNLPGWHTWAGAALIVASTWYIAAREAKLRTRTGAGSA